MTDIPKNLCYAPFTHFTMDANLNASPCPALGGSIWNFKGQRLSEIWNSDTLEEFRHHMLNNGKHEVCNRCWSEESVGFTSERLKIAAQKHSIEDYQKGPVQLALKISNVCNLRCRSCNGADSSTLSIEGKRYAQNPEWKDNFYVADSKRKQFTDAQIEEIVEWSGNLRRLEIYGGEPFLDDQTFKLLDEIAKTGRAGQIQLNVSTNITHRLEQAKLDLLSRFAHININLSIDGWGARYEYLRSGGVWEEVYENIKWFKRMPSNQSLAQRTDQAGFSILPVCTVTSMNVFYIGELADNLYNEFELKPYYILSTHPKYYSVFSMPSETGAAVAEHLSNHSITDLTAITTALTQSGDEENWAKFWRWNNMVDEYRKEKFSDVFPEYYKLLEDTSSVR